MRPAFFIRWILVLLITSPFLASEPDTMVLQGDLSALYANGDFVIWNPKRESGRPMAMAAGTNTEEKDKPTSLESTLDVVGKAPIGTDGRFILEVAVDHPRQVNFYVLNATHPNGEPISPIKGNSFILEPGQLRLTMSRGDRFTIVGGKYNEAVYNAWRESEPYLVAEVEHERLSRPVAGESEESRRMRVDRASAAYARTLELENEGRSHIARTHPDSVTRRLAIETAWLIGPWVLDALRNMAKLTPDDPWVIERLAREEKDALRRAEERKHLATGANIRDFTAMSLSGEAVNLATVRANSRYVLLEFWASWCGPCRIEIPHMKEAYERFREKGFEIVSFTIDNNREDWELASEEEDLPWINLGFGQDAKAAKAFNVTGVPKNFLVDSKSGKIDATDLRGHHLDEKLEELFE
ncbi:MAG: TlpA disulfide reductase family protein [Gammaproteobacteria bacterium]|nr:TlpA disulfide reductase family protein [Gammaproteobacteria bacterium]